MFTNLLIFELIIIGSTILLGCRDHNYETAQRSLSHLSPDENQPQAMPDLISGKWSWVTPAIPAAPTKQFAILKRSGESLTGKVVWMLDEEPSGDIINGTTDGRKVSFDTIIFLRDDATQRRIKLVFSYRGTLEDTKRMRISGSCKLTGSKDGTPTTFEYPWNAFLER